MSIEYKKGSLLTSMKRIYNLYLYRKAMNVYGSTHESKAKAMKILMRCFQDPDSLCMKVYRHDDKCRSMVLKIHNRDNLREWYIYHKRI